MANERFFTCTGAEVLIVVLLVWLLYLVMKMSKAAKPTTVAAPKAAKAETFKVTPIHVAVPGMQPVSQPIQTPPQSSFKMLDVEEDESNFGYPYTNYDSLPQNNDINFSSEGRGWTGAPTLRRQLANGMDINDFVRN